MKLLLICAISWLKRRRAAFAVSINRKLITPRWIFCNKSCAQGESAIKDLISRQFIYSVSASDASLWQLLWRNLESTKSEQAREWEKSPPGFQQEKRVHSTQLLRFRPSPTAFHTFRMKQLHYSFEVPINLDVLLKFLIITNPKTRLPHFMLNNIFKGSKKSATCFLRLRVKAEIWH